jgi:hypothetical protein
MARSPGRLPKHCWCWIISGIIVICGNVFDDDDDMMMMMILGRFQQFVWRVINESMLSCLMCLDTIHKDKSHGFISSRSISPSRNLCVCEWSVSFHWPPWEIVLVMLLRQKPWLGTHRQIVWFQLTVVGLYRSTFRRFTETHFIHGQNWPCPLIGYLGLA